MAQPPSDASDVALRMALAVVGSSSSPLLLLDGDLIIVRASQSFCEAFSVDCAAAVGQVLGDLGAGEWDSPQLRSLLTATMSGGARIEAYELDLKRSGRAVRRLVLNAHMLDYGPGEPARLLLGIADVTDARASEREKDDLLREKAILLQELQHRVANSLQIIASVLMQSARKVSSEESRSHLEAAHGRVMSVAAVQKQLSASRVGKVALRPYFAQLCQSLAASMIHDLAQLSLQVETDDVMVDAEVSVSLGLIVTELVINALKHAFPGHRTGAILVGYRAEGEKWTLSVRDDGVGMPSDESGATAGRAGLGTSIVEALARQLRAAVRVDSSRQGVTISIVHDTASENASAGDPAVRAPA